MDFNKEYKYKFTLEKFLTSNNIKTEDMSDVERIWTSYCDCLEVTIISEELGRILFPNGDEIKVVPEWCEVISPQRLEL